MTETLDRDRKSPLCDDFYPPASSSEIGPRMDDPVTPTNTSTVLNEHQIEQLQIENRTTVEQAESQARFVGSPAPFRSSPARVPDSPILRSFDSPRRRASLSLRLSSELRALRDEQAQEQRTVDYLQANGLELASTRRSAQSDPLSSSSKTSSTKVDRIARMLSGIMPPKNGSDSSRVLSSAPQPDVSDSEARRKSLSRTRRTLHRVKARRLDRRYDEDDLDASMADQMSPEQTPSFRARRAREGTNWFSGSRASKTLPPRFEPPEGLRESLRANKNGSLRGNSSRSVSLRLRNHGLPPAYTLPSEQTTLAVGSAVIPGHEAGDDRLPHGTLNLWPPLDLLSRGQTAAPMIRDPDEDDQSIPAPLNVPQRPPLNLAIDTKMSGAFPSPKRGSRFNEVMKGANGGSRPSMPPKSPDRMSARNSTLLSNRGSVVSPVPGPASEVVPSAANSNERKEITRTSLSIFSVIWLVAAALTLFGISRISPLNSHTPMCTLEQVHTCTPSSLSFKHNLRLNTTLPSIPSLQLNNIEDLTLIDRGIEVLATNPTSRVRVRAGLSLGSFISDDGTSLLSDITYAGVIDGDGEDKDFRSRLGAMMKQNSRDNERKMVKLVSAQGASRAVSVRMSIALSEQLCFAFWLGCMLAVELTLLCYFVILPMMSMGVMLVWCDWLKKERGAVQREGVWKHETSTACRIAFLGVLAGALGTAGASGILIAFWT